MQQRGFFITFEGSEGCGKSTQIRRLATRLEKSGHTIVVTREPGGTPIGEEIKHLLQFSKIGHAMTSEAELLLFTASRAQLVRELIEPSLKTGAVVIADRFLDSTTVYQGVARNLEPASVKFINDFAVGTCRPDITFVLDLDAKVARERMLRRPRPVDAGDDRMEQQPAEFYDAVRAGYLDLAKVEPERIRVIDGGKSADEVEADIWNQAQPLLTAL